MSFLIGVFLLHCSVHFEIIKNRTQTIFTFHVMNYYNEIHKEGKHLQIFKMNEQNRILSVSLRLVFFAIFDNLPRYILQLSNTNLTSKSKYTYIFSGFYKEKQQNCLDKMYMPKQAMK